MIELHMAIQPASKFQSSSTLVNNALSNPDPNLITHMIIITMNNPDPKLALLFIITHDHNHYEQP